MRLQAGAVSQNAIFEGETVGEGLSIYFSQKFEATLYWKLDVYAGVSGEGEYYVGSVVVSPPQATVLPGLPSRLVAVAACPGATNWRVLCSASGAQENAQIQLASSKSGTPEGLHRVNERYGYSGASVNTSFVPLLGQTVTRVQAFGKAGGGTMQIGPTGPVLTVDAGSTVVLEPKARINESIAFTGCSFVVEYLESA